MRNIFVAALALSSALSASATCYTVYNPSGAMVYRAQAAPIDMSRPIREGLNRLVPGGHLVFGSDDADCPAQANLPGSTVVARENAQEVVSRLAATQMAAPADPRMPTSTADEELQNNLPAVRSPLRPGARGASPATSGRSLVQ